MTREHALAVIGNTNLSLLAWSDRLLGVRRYSTAAAGNSLVDNQRLVAHIGEGKGSLLYRI